MNIAMLSYPMFTQAIGGLKIQLFETIAALNQLGWEARLIDPYTEKLSDFDLVHVFGAGNGNHRIVRHANQVGRPVVMSPLIQPHWDRALGRRARWLHRGVQRLTRWHVATEYGDLQAGLSNADHLFALGKPEKRSIVEAFEVASDRIDIVPNGIPERFFHATPQLFLDRFGLEPGFVLCVASIDAHKNQLGLAQALVPSGRQLVLIGPCLPEHKPYLDQVTAIPGVRYLGSLAYVDPLLASAYAAAGVFCLASFSEVMPLCVLEALAAGTPAVMTRNHGMDTSGMAASLLEIDPHSPDEIAQAVSVQFATGTSASACKAAVSHLTWEAAARRLATHYERLLKSADGHCESRSRP
jgi:glycosyltransferase involved in cell wall biosynthesis